MYHLNTRKFIFKKTHLYCSIHFLIPLWKKQYLNIFIRLKDFIPPPPPPPPFIYNWHEADTGVPRGARASEWGGLKEKEEVEEDEDEQEAE